MPVQNIFPSWNSTQEQDMTTCATFKAKLFLGFLYLFGSSMGESKNSTQEVNFGGSNKLLRTSYKKTTKSGKCSSKRPPLPSVCLL